MGRSHGTWAFRSKRDWGQGDLSTLYYPKDMGVVSIRFEDKEREIRDVFCM